MASNQNIVITCRGCNGKAPVSEMRLAQNGKDMLCRSCQEKQNLRSGMSGSKAAFSTKKPMAQSKPISKAAPEKTKARITDMVSYHCLKCKYKFSRKADFTLKKCPYCGSDRIETTDKYSAETLVRQADPDDDF
ncbi:MAG: hypothetical protein V1725_01860 [archaeon]